VPPLQTGIGKEREMWVEGIYRSSRDCWPRFSDLYFFLATVTGSKASIKQTPAVPKQLGDALLISVEE